MTEFHLHPTPSPRPRQPRPLTITRTKQAALFDAGRNDLPGQRLMFPDIATQDNHTTPTQETEQ